MSAPGQQIEDEAATHTIYSQITGKQVLPVCISFGYVEYERYPFVCGGWLNSRPVLYWFLSLKVAMDLGRLEY